MYKLQITPLAVLAALALSAPAPQPPTQENVLAALESDGNFTTLVSAIRAAGLEEALSAEGPITIFAPTDAAFEKLPEGRVQELLADPATLKSILSLHVVPKAVAGTDITDESMRLTTLAGSDLLVVREDGNVVVQTAPTPAREVMTEEEEAGMVVATVGRADLSASNGVIHAIDTVLLPVK